MLVNVNEFCECQKFLHYNVMTLRTVQELYIQIPGQMSSWEIEGLEEILEQEGKDAWMEKRKLLVGETAPWEFLLSAVLPKIIICASIPVRNRLQLHISTHRIGAWRKQEITHFFVGEILAVGSTIHFMVEYGTTIGSCVGVLKKKIPFTVCFIWVISLLNHEVDYTCLRHFTNPW